MLNAFYRQQMYYDFSLFQFVNVDFADGGSKHKSSTISIKVHADGLKNDFCEHCLLNDSQSNLVTCKWTLITRNFTTLQSRAVLIPVSALLWHL